MIHQIVVLAHKTQEFIDSSAVHLVKSKAIFMFPPLVQVLCTAPIISVSGPSAHSCHVNYTFACNMQRNIGSLYYYHNGSLYVQTPQVSVHVHRMHTVLQGQHNKCGWPSIPNLSVPEAHGFNSLFATLFFTTIKTQCRKALSLHKHATIFFKKEEV